MNTNTRKASNTAPRLVSIAVDTRPNPTGWRSPKPSAVNVSVES